jgi:hypothetical protein
MPAAAGCLAAPPQSADAVRPPRRLPALEVVSGGARVRPLNPARGRWATVLLFVTHDCPVSNQYAPEVNRIVAEYARQGIGFYLVYVEPGLSRAVARAHIRAFGYACPAVLDPQHVLVGHAGASVTPEAAVYSPTGARVYRGRIDDRYPVLGRRREQVTTRDLRAALDAVLTGKPVPVPVTKAVGCFIPPASPK